MSTACPWDTRAERLDSRLNAVAQVRQALSALRGIGDVTTMLHKAAVEVCETCGFDRAIISHLHRSRIVIDSAYIPDHPELAARLLEPGTTSRPHLDNLLIETQMISNNKPILVTDIDSEPRTQAGFVTCSGPGLTFTSPRARPSIISDLPGRLAVSSPPPAGHRILEQAVR